LFWTDGEIDAVKKILLGLALASTLVVPSAYAADQTVSIVGNSASFIGTDPSLSGGDDVITFTGLANGAYDFQVTVSAQNIVGLGATINGQAATILGGGNLWFAGLESTGTAPFVLTLTGTPGSGTPKYSGELTVTAVPEPNALALMLAGLGLVGFDAARRKPS
jgi:tetrahydromethanopterin S-methyltransferase subunit F